MQALKLMALIFWVLSCSGCASVMTRYGYDLNDIPNRNTYLGCRVPVMKNFQYSKDDVEVVGSIKAGDTGVSIECGKGYVIGVFRQEACSLGADLVNITYERGLDIWSSCYRAKAEFLRYKDRARVKVLVSDAEYE